MPSTAKPGETANMKPTLLFFAVTVLLLTACASTTKQASWTDPENAGKKIDSVFIIGAAREELTRRVFEDDLARRLTAVGVKGITSYQHMRLDALDDRQAAVGMVKALGADAVIIAQVVGERAEQVVNPGFTEVRGRPYYPTHAGDHWHDFYRSSYSVVSRPPTVANFQVVTVETSLYGADGKMIWSMRSETATASGQAVQSTIEEFVGVVVDDLAANGLI